MALETKWKENEKTKKSREEKHQEKEGSMRENHGRWTVNKNSTKILSIEPEDRDKEKAKRNKEKANTVAVPFIDCLGQIITYEDFQAQKISS